MSRPLKLPAVGVCFALGIAAVLACNGGHDQEDDNQFRDDVLWCEEAVARLQRCCPNFDVRRIACQYYYSFDEGCGTSSTRKIEPAYTKSESACVRERSCDALVNEGICTRAQEQGNARSSTQITSTSSTSSSGSTGFSSTSGSTGFSSASSGSTSGTSGSTSGTSGTLPREVVCQ